MLDISFTSEDDEEDGEDEEDEDEERENEQIESSQTEKVINVEGKSLFSTHIRCPSSTHKPQNKDSEEYINFKARVIAALEADPVFK